MAMAMAKHLLMALLAMATLATTSHAWGVSLDVQLSGDVIDMPPLIHMLRPRLGSGGWLGDHDKQCSSWRLGVEAHNVRDWNTIPGYCKNYVGNYMLGKQYRRDSAVVVDQAVAYAEGLELSGNDTEVWVFDVDETSLSNLPYYAKHGFGAEPYNATAFNQWVLSGKAPALPETERLYKKLLSLGIKPVFLTGRGESLKKVTAANLIETGFCTWHKLLLKPESLNVSAIEYKSAERKKLEDAGMVIVGNIGDQWSDILGQPEGLRTFKLPDPMYYIG